jgi:hypothetical protein
MLKHILRSVTKKMLRDYWFCIWEIRLLNKEIRVINKVSITCIL